MYKKCSSINMHLSDFMLLELKIIIGEVNYALKEVFFSIDFPLQIFQISKYG